MANLLDSCRAFAHGRRKVNLGDRAQSRQFRQLGVAEVGQRGDGADLALAAAVDRALSSNRMREQAAGYAARLQATDPPAVAAALLESLVR